MKVVHTVAGLAVVLGLIGAVGAVEAQAGGLVPYEAKDNAIAKSLTGKSGDPVNGRAVSINRKLGNCLACHKMPVPEQSFHGEIGPDLNGVASRLNEAELRMQVVNSKAINPDSMMPAFYRVEGLHAVKKNFKGKPILSAEQVEDVVAYLTTLKD